MCCTSPGCAFASWRQITSAFAFSMKSISPFLCAARTPLTFQETSFIAATLHRPRAHPATPNPPPLTHTTHLPFASPPLTPHTSHLIPSRPPHASFPAPPSRPAHPAQPARRLLQPPAHARRPRLRGKGPRDDAPPHLRLPA